jgi:nitrate reductase delta subunit
MDTGTVMGTELSDVYALVARLLSYPDGETLENVTAGRALLALTYPEAAAPLGGFSVGIAGLTPGALEELYVGTFDVQAACCLDVGYAMFGEDYKRGQCMAQLKILHAKHGVDCGSELPDFLPNVLKLLPRLAYGDAAELTRMVVVPAVEKMLGGFDGDSNPYRFVLELTRDLLKRDYLAQ